MIRFYTEAVAQMSSVKSVFLENLQTLQESTCARVSLFNKEHLSLQSTSGCCFFLHPLKMLENQLLSEGMEMKHWPEMGQYIRSTF